MSAHRDPDAVAEYAANARMRGLRVIIAGAGISAALPGAIAARTDLPVIGVPLSGRLVGRGRPRLDPLDRADAAGRPGRVRGPEQRAQRRGSRGADPRRHDQRYTREELGRALDRRGEDASSGARSRSLRARSCRRCSERSRGPSEAELEAVRERRFTVEAVRERERATGHDVAAFVDVLGASAGEAGRWIHFGLTSSDVLDTALALQLRAAGEVILDGRACARGGARGPRARAR